MNGTTSVDSWPATLTAKLASSAPRVSVTTHAAHGDRRRTRRHRARPAPNMLCSVPDFASSEISLGEIRALFAARCASSTTKPATGTVSENEPPEARRENLHPAGERAIDDDVIVPERRHGSGLIHQNAQLGLLGIDAIDRTGDRRWGCRRLRRSSAEQPGGASAHRMRSTTSARTAAPQHFQHDPRPALLLNYVACSVHAEPLDAKSKAPDAL